MIGALRWITYVDVNFFYPYSTEKRSLHREQRVRLIKFWNVEILPLRFRFLDLETIHKVVFLNSKISRRE